MLCDVCNVTVTESNSKRISPERFRQLLAKGFSIDETNIRMLTDAGMPRAQAVEMLSEQYRTSQSDWLLCTNCFTKAESVLPSNENSIHDLIELALRTNELLQQYVKIHDDIFAFSVRKMIPLPGIFKAIDYQSHFEGLYFIKEELEGIISSIAISPQSNNEFARALEAYSKSLLETILILREMCGNLYEKSQGDLTSYRKSQYNVDLRNYQASVERYTALGQRLNAYFQRK
jgi:hypothetical protein